MSERFNPPPRWPEPPSAPVTREDRIHPDPAWGEVPAGWRLWTSAEPSDAAAPLVESSTIPASGVVAPARDDDYPVEVTMPGVRIEHDREPDDRGFGPAPRRRRASARTRLIVSLVILLIGVAAAGGMAYVFTRLHHYATHDRKPAATAHALGIADDPLHRALS